MEIFKWAREIEEIYENLIEKAKDENLSEIKEVRSKQEKLFEKEVKEKQEIVKSALKVISNDVDKENNNFKEQLNNYLKKIEINYQENKERLIDLIFEKLGFNF